MTGHFSRRAADVVGRLGLVIESIRKDVFVLLGTVVEIRGCFRIPLIDCEAQHHLCILSTEPPPTRYIFQGRYFSDTLGRSTMDT